MKVVFIQNSLLHYRIPFYQLMAKTYDVTVIHSGRKLVGESKGFNEVVLKSKKLGPIYIQKGLPEAIDLISPDIIVGMFDIRWVSTFLYLIRRSKVDCRFIWWGLDTGGSKLATWLKVRIAQLKFPIVFYTQANLDKFRALGVSNPKMYVANNSFDVGERYPCYDVEHKDTVLFVGSFDRRKQLNILITAFYELIDEVPKDINLVIIGDGEVRNEVHKQVITLGIHDRVNFTGKINDPKHLLEYYKKAIVSVSFGQAGLSVLQSLGFGVPFIAKRNAITGGELSNIEDGFNGFLCEDNIESLKEHLLLLINNVTLAKEMGLNASGYYSRNCSIDNMVEGFTQIFSQEVV